jgi:RNA-binding protein
MLSGKDKRQLRALGHHLSAVVMVGDKGVTAGVIAATSEALTVHELIKVKFSDEDRDSRREGFETRAKETKSEIAQAMGRTVLLFKQRAKKSKIKLKSAGPSDVTADVKAKKATPFEEEEE